jgi:hypothetical protein
MSHINVVKASEFVKRQTKDSRFSHSDHSWDDVVEMTNSHLYSGEYEAGYREGVVLVQVPSNGFYSAIAETKDVIEWVDVYEARQEGEEPVHTRVGVVDAKPEALFTDIVLYHVDVLAEDDDYIRSGDHEWEIVSVNCRLQEYPIPIPPMTMSRNFLANKGGTLAEYTALEFADSIWYWGTHCLVKEA